MGAMRESGNGLDLRELAAGNIPAITTALGAALAEAGGVCLGFCCICWVF